MHNYAILSLVDLVLITCGESYRNESLQGMNSNGVPHIRLDKKWSELSKKFAKINSEILEGLIKLGM